MVVQCPGKVKHLLNAPLDPRPVNVRAPRGTPQPRSDSGRWQIMRDVGKRVLAMKGGWAPDRITSTWLA